MPHAIAYFVYSDYSVHYRRRRSHRDQRVHVRRAVEQRFKSVHKIFFIDYQNGKRQQKLRKRKRHHILMPREKRRERKSPHMPHTYIKQRDHKHQRYQKSVSHRFYFALRFRLFLRSLTFYGRRVSGRGDSLLYDVYARRCVKFHNHRLCQQIHLHTIYTRNLAHAFFHICGAGGARHALHIKFLLHCFSAPYAFTLII